MKSGWKKILTQYFVPFVSPSLFEVTVAMASECLCMRTVDMQVKWISWRFERYLQFFRKQNTLMCSLEISNHQRHRMRAHSFSVFASLYGQHRSEQLFSLCVWSFFLNSSYLLWTTFCHRSYFVHTAFYSESAAIYLNSFAMAIGHATRCV